ncbi:MAG: hypothetical protein ACRC92_07505 [Peptostreptococcaceae bacterium]
MRKSNSMFFMILSESLILFLIFGLFTYDKEITKWIIAVIGISFLFAYTVADLYPRLINKYGEKYYKLILALQNIFMANVLYFVGRILGYGKNYISFIIIYAILGIATYLLNRRMYIKEINYLNNIIKKYR